MRKNIFKENGVGRMSRLITMEILNCNKYPEPEKKLKLIEEFAWQNQ